jgi:hypothetical protein
MKDLQNRYFVLGNELESRYPHLNFKNHCYWRIALDNTVQAKWDQRIKRRPAYLNLSNDQLKRVVILLEEYLQNQELLLMHNQTSLRFRTR